MTNKLPIEGECPNNSTSRIKEFINFLYNKEISEMYTKNIGKD
jgi:hypothetical protein